MSIFNRVKIAPIIVILTVSIGFAFVTFRWMSSRDRANSTAAIEGVLRNEYSVANSYALSKALTDLESLNILRCAVLTEKVQTNRVFYDTSNRASCRKPFIVSRFFVLEANLHAINGLTYQLQFQLPLRWQSILLEIMTYLLILSLAYLYQRHTRIQSLKQSFAEALFLQSRQIAHDIRSPLSALNMAASSLKDMPEEKRNLIRQATQRINDIANNLLQQGTKPTVLKKSDASPTPSAAQEPMMIVTILETIISEKRLQYSERPEIEIKGDLSEGYGLFTDLNASEFARVISNLVNNSVEAIDSSGRIVIAVRGYKNHIGIIVSDNGRGIPAAIISRLGEKGASFGKEGMQSGSGLGLFHAREAIEQAGGSLRIESRVGVGTQITMTLPHSKAPMWFIDRLCLSNDQPLIAVDDDSTVHRMWSERLISVCSKGESPNLVNLSSLIELEKWIAANPKASGKFLIDYDFATQTENGLGAIERLGIASNSVLVTSRFDEPDIKTKATALGVRILPKMLGPYLPIEIVRLERSVNGDDPTIA